MTSGAISRRTLLSASAAAAGAALVGCGSDTPSGREPGEKITLTFWSWVPGVDKAVALWNEKHPDVRVKLEKVTAGSDGAYPKMHAALKAGNPPDLGQIEYSRIPDFLLGQGLEDLTKHGVAKHKDKFVDWQWQQSVFGDGVYAIPQASGPMGLFYREDLFSKWDIEPPKTWDEYEAAAKKIRKADSKAYICTFPPANGGWFTGLAWQNGAKWFDVRGEEWVVNIDNPETRQVAEYWEGLIRGKLVKTEMDIQSSWFADLQSGAIVSWVGAQWGDAILAGNAEPTSGKWRVAAMPMWDTAKPASANWGGSTTAVLKGSKYPKDALAFAVWLNTDPESIDLMIAGGYGWPAAKDAFSGSALDKPSEFFGGQKYNEVFAESDRLVDKSWKWIPTLEATNRHIGDAFNAAISDKTPFVDAIAKIHKQTIADMKAKDLKVVEG
ncbi:MAG: ABC transporter substrate-binding protein [Micromonosporaceae bacterium]